MEPGSITIEHYRLLELLGHGINGTVFLALEQRSGKLCAVKVLNRLALNNDDGFESAVTSVQERSNNYCAKPFDHGVTHQGLRYVALNYYPAGSLANFNRYVNVRFAEKAFLEMCFALEPFHYRSEYHGAIKPTNILVAFENRELRFNLSDFTLNATRSAESAAGQSASPASDVYSLGLTILELIEGSTEEITPSIRGRFGDLLQKTLSTIETRPTISDCKKILMRKSLS